MTIYDQLFKEFSIKWQVDCDTVRVIYLLVENFNGYKRTSKALSQLGFKITPRRLEYFYKKVSLTQRYGTKEKIGKDNYRKLVLNKI